MHRRWRWQTVVKCAARRPSRPWQCKSRMVEVIGKDGVYIAKVEELHTVCVRPRQCASGAVRRVRLWYGNECQVYVARVHVSQCAAPVFAQRMSPFARFTHQNHEYACSTFASILTVRLG